jgi:BlaI family transcriptional regulator, penicillinase repressor
MARPKSENPTARELEILQVLWNLGPSTIREITEELNRERRKKVAYNSVLTILGIMQQKGYVTRSEKLRSHIYRASYTQVAIENQLIERLIADVFGGSAMRLVTRALAKQPASPEELDEIQELLESMRSTDESTS